MKQRCYEVIKKAMLILALGGVYFVFCRIIGKGIPCVFHMVTGWYCPGCGISRMFIALSQFDIYAAAGANIFVLFLLPVAGGIWLYKTVRYIRRGTRKDPPALNVCYVILLVLAIVFGVLRNLEVCAFLAPH